MQSNVCDALGRINRQANATRIAAKRWSRKTSVLDICGSHRPGTDGNIEFVNTAALVHRHMGKIPECCRIIDEN
jgi:hypothetical protein